MSKSLKRTPAGEILTAFTMDVFRVNNLILSAGDRLVGDLGLTSARWQILGAIARIEQPQSVAGLARNLGANRQNVQRIVNDLRTGGFLSFEVNPRHRRAQLVLLTDKGREAYREAMGRQAPWANRVTEGLPVSELETFQRVLLQIRERLEAGEYGPATPEAAPPPVRVESPRSGKAAGRARPSHRDSSGNSRKRSL